MNFQQRRGARQHLPPTLRAHQSARVSPLGLKITAVAAIEKDVRGLVARGSRRLPSKIPHCVQRLMGKETGKLSPGAWVPRFLALLTTPLQRMMEGCILKYTPLHMI